MKYDVKLRNTGIHEPRAMNGTCNWKLIGKIERKGDRISIGGKPTKGNFATCYIVLKGCGRYRGRVIGESLL